MDKLSSMKTFVKVAEVNSFSTAAAQLGVGCAAVTRSISSLESQLGVRLLERTTRRISLTPAGAAYLECCRNVISMIEATESDLAGDAQVLSGTIRVAISHLHGNRIFGPLLVKFAKLHPGIRLELQHFDLFSETVAAEVDVALLVGDERKKARDSVSLGVIGMQLAASPEYVAQYGVPAHPGELSAHRCLNLASLPARPVWKFAENGQMVDYVVNACLSTRSGDVLLEAALSGLGLACLPEEVVAPYVKARSLQPVLRSWSLASLEAALSVSTDKLVTHRTKSLCVFLSTQFAVKCQKASEAVLDNGSASLPPTRPLSRRRNSRVAA